MPSPSDVASLSLFLLDAADLAPFYKALRKQPDLQGKSVLIGETGVQLSIPNEEYELAWMCYSGNPHELFPKRKELVAFIYDAFA